MIPKEQLENLISAELDGALSSDEQQILEQALRESEEARALKFAFRQNRELLKNLPRAKVPHLTGERFQKALLVEKQRVQTPKPQASGSQGIWPSLLAAGLFLALGLGFYLWTHTQTRGSILYLVPDALADSHAVREQVLALHETSEPALTLYSPPLYGRYTGGKTRFALKVDSGAIPSAAQVRISYDLQNNGTYDRVEIYRPFPTDDQDGWQLYTDSWGKQEAQGELQDLQGGRVKLEVWMPEGYQVLALRMGASHDSSFLRLPHRNVRLAEEAVAKLHDFWFFEKLTARRSERPPS